MSDDPKAPAAWLTAIDRGTTSEISVSVSEAVLLTLLGSVKKVAVAVFFRVPTAESLTVATIVNVAVAPGASVILLLIFPDPSSGPLDAVPE